MIKNTSDYSPVAHWYDQTRCRSAVFRRKCTTVPFRNERGREPSEQGYVSYSAVRPTSAAIAPSRSVSWTVVI